MISLQISLACTLGHRHNKNKNTINNSVPVCTLQSETVNKHYLFIAFNKISRWYQNFYGICLLNSLTFPIFATFLCKNSCLGARRVCSFFQCINSSHLISFWITLGPITIFKLAGWNGCFHFFCHLSSLSKSWMINQIDLSDLEFYYTEDIS